MQETWVRSLNWEDPLEKEMANHSIFLLGNPMYRGAWQAAVQGIARVRYDFATKQQQEKTLCPALRSSTPGCKMLS